MHEELCYVPGSPGLRIIAGMGNAGGDRSFGPWAAPPAAPLPHGSGAQLRSLLLEAVGQHWGLVGMGADPGTERASPAHQTTCAPSLPVFWERHRAAPQQGRSSRPPQGTCHGRCDVGQRPLCTVPEHSQGQNHHPATGAGLWQGPHSRPTPCCLWVHAPYRHWDVPYKHGDTGMGPGRSLGGSHGTGRGVTGRALTPG